MEETLDHDVDTDAVEHALARQRDGPEIGRAIAPADELQPDRKPVDRDRQRDGRMAREVEQLGVLEHRGADGELGAVTERHLRRAENAAPTIGSVGNTSASHLRERPRQRRPRASGTRRARQSTRRPRSLRPCRMRACTAGL